MSIDLGSHVWRKVAGAAATGMLGLALVGCGGGSSTTSTSSSSGSAPAATSSSGSASASAPAATSSSGSASSTSTGGSTVTLQEAGSSLMYPLFNVWVPAYTKTHNVKLTPAAGGSGKGLAEAASGVIQIGASDAYLSPANMKKNPGLMNIPLVISSQMVCYNVPGLSTKHLNLSGPVIADIYSGKITKWNDPAIAKINPGVKLPDLTIVPIHRSDGSGDTFIFTQYLSASTPSWSHGPGFGVSVSWPSVQGAQGASGNNGMVDALSKTKGGIAYIGISWSAQVAQAGLNYAALGNKAGNFVLPTNQNVVAAAGALEGKTPANEAISLIFAPGKNSYPIINYEYSIVQAKQPNAQTATAIKNLLTWALNPSEGSSSQFLSKLGFKPLPSSIVKLSQAQIAKIH